jgi:HK97 family phage major capsid protein
MSSDKTKLRVSDALPIAYFVDENTNNGRKNITKAAWKNVFITAEELAVIVPIKENLLNDASVDLWAEIKPQLTSAIAKTVDAAVFKGEGAPTSWGEGIIPQIIAKGKTVKETGELYSDINDTMVKVEESGYDVTALLGGVNLKGKFRMMTDKNGQPLATTEIGSLRREYLDNGSWNKETATLIAGDFNQAVYAIRQDVDYKVLTEAVIQDPSSGEILYNLAQEDMVALRVTFRMGYAIPNPVNALDGTETRYPFAALVPEEI